MKPGLFLFVFIAIGVIIAGSFGLQIMPNAVPPLPDSIAASALFVCPAESSVFGQIAQTIIPFQNQMVIVFFFVLMLIFAMYAWALYKNLLNDKFEAKEYATAWWLLKTLFWATVILTVLANTPNGLRSVKLQGIDGNFVLCEDNTPGARPVRASAVILHHKIRP